MAENAAIAGPPTDWHPGGACDGLDMDWAEREYGRCPHADGRARRRIAGMGRARFQNMGVDLSVIFPREAEQRAVSRPLSSPRVSMTHIPGRTVRQPLTDVAGSPLSPPRGTQRQSTIRG